MIKMLQDVALGLLTSSVAVEGTARLIVDIAMYFGLFVIVAMALNFQYGNAGIPNICLLYTSPSPRDRS